MLKPDRKSTARKIVSGGTTVRIPVKKRVKFA